MRVVFFPLIAVLTLPILACGGAAPLPLVPPPPPPAPVVARASDNLPLALQPAMTDDPVLDKEREELRKAHDSLRAKLASPTPRAEAATPTDPFVSPPPPPAPEPEVHVNPPPPPPAAPHAGCDSGFAGSYKTDWGNASVTQSGCTVDVEYALGTMRCAASGSNLDCVWHERSSTGKATFVRGEDGAWTGSWGGEASATEGGAWTFTPLG